MKPNLWYHHSHDPHCRWPFGSQPTGNNISLTLYYKGALTNQPQVALVVNKEPLEESFTTAPLASSSNPQGCEDECKSYTFSITTPSTSCLLWYYFIITCEDTAIYYGNNSEGLGGEGCIYKKDTLPSPYQITVYEDEPTPLWLHKGLIYQIYVDRFYNGNEAGLVNPLPKKSLLHSHWDDTPLYIRHEDHSIRRWDFFGGNLKGIIKKLDYLTSLGVSILYLNPIFTASSNHKYDTGDYLTIDPSYGHEHDFTELTLLCRDRGIKVLLDGVFSHTGADSIYFNRYGHYPSEGAYKNPDSPYRGWYTFNDDHDNYSSWWGIDDLPNVNELQPSFLDFLLYKNNSVIKKWMQCGIAGWRLDVADELPDPFIRKLKETMKSENDESILIGEVWEDATNKRSYGTLRTYLLGGSLDGVMNYPLRQLLIGYTLEQMTSHQFLDFYMHLYENYPKDKLYGSMNLAGSHDRRRVLTVLGEAPEAGTLKDFEKEAYRLPLEKRRLAIKRLKLLSLIQYCLPGIPTLYYGDEAGLEGYPDPYNRGTYPWGREETELLTWYQRLGNFYHHHTCLSLGDFCPLYEDQQTLAFIRRYEDDELLCLFNSGHEPLYYKHLVIPSLEGICIDVHGHSIWPINEQ